MGARYYAAWLGRWTSADPLGVGADGPGVYNYTRGSPVNLVDPGGKWSISSLVAQAKASQGTDTEPNWVEENPIHGRPAESVEEMGAGGKLAHFNETHRPVNAMEPGNTGNATDLISASDVSAILAEDAILEARDYTALSERGNPLWEQNASGEWARTSYLSLPVGTSDVELYLATAGMARAAAAGGRLVASEVRSLRALGAADEAFAAELAGELGAIETSFAVGPVDDALIAVGDNALIAAADDAVLVLHGPYVHHITHGG